MNIKILLIVLAVVVVLAGVIYFLVGNKPAGTNVPYGTGDVSPTSTQKKSGTSGAKTMPSVRPISYVVNLTDTGPNPSVLDISSGDTVKFTNTGTRPFWVASDPHPTHDLCPGFDSMHGLVHGESWSYTFKFTAPKTCPYHNHVDVTTAWYKGTINVK